MDALFEVEPIPNPTPGLFDGVGAPELVAPRPKPKRAPAEAASSVKATPSVQRGLIGLDLTEGSPEAGFGIALADQEPAEPAPLPAAPAPKTSRAIGYRVSARGYVDGVLVFDTHYAAADYARALDPRGFRVVGLEPTGATVSASTGRALARCRAKGCRRAHQVTYVVESVHTAWNNRPHWEFAVMVAGRPVGYRDRAGLAAAVLRSFTCTACGGSSAEFIVVRGRVVESVKCGPKCRGAVGPSCDCSCGGDNHGSGHASIVL